METNTLTTKVCTKCGKYKLLDEFYSWADKRTLQVRYQAWCKQCAKQHRADIQSGTTTARMRTKSNAERSGISIRCHSCNEFKDAVEFVIGRFREQYVCTDCRNQGHLCYRNFCDIHRIG